jgi:N-acetylated-alpha-linked acidic dipeptidase
MPTTRFLTSRSLGQVFCYIVGLPLVHSPTFADVGADAPSKLLGFSIAHAASQQALEKKFDALLDPADQRAWLERMSAEPNHIGAPHNKANAEFMLEKFREWGWDAQIETFYVLFPTPTKQALEMIGPTQFKARLHEPALEGDRTSSKTKDALPPYHAYGADGDVTGDWFM